MTQDAGADHPAVSGRDDLEPGLTVRSLEVIYHGAVVALAGISLDVPIGAFVAVLGANGAGKTTLVRAITKLLFVHGGKVTDGHLSFAGQNLDAADASTVVRAGICQVPEGRKLFPRLTVEENLRVGAATRRDREISDDVDRIFDLFPQVARRRKERAGFLSGGEQQMIAVGRALMARPKLLICDELSLGLAPMVVQELFELLTSLNRDEGLTVLAIEQNARLALQAATYGYVLETGRVAVEGSAAELRENPHVQEYYMGGSGEAQDAYRAVVERYKRPVRAQ
jgi:branched-chain amino acid transport system ATP-binding protein